MSCTKDPVTGEGESPWLRGSGNGCVGRLLRSYFVQELTAALVLFTIGFFLIALLFFAAILLVNLFANAHARESSNRLLQDAPVLLAPRPGKMH
jgi:hypothetical protein